MQKIVPHLWYDTKAKEAALFYVSLFDNSHLVQANSIPDTPSGDAETVSLELCGQEFQAISAGPYFTINPSISLMVACVSKDEVDALWKALSTGGVALMPLDEYHFSKWFGWVQDRYGLSWQLNLFEGERPAQKITPHLLFSDEARGRAEEAIRYYCSVFSNSKIGVVRRYGDEESNSLKGKINFASFSLCGQDFSAMDNSYDAEFNFNEAFSFIINCRDQSEIDYFWNKLSAVPEAEQCGWVKDQFGVSWQIIPECMGRMMESGDENQIQRVTEAFLKMKKFDVQALQNAFDGI